MAFPGWTAAVLGVMAKLRFLRGSAFDPFGRTAERIAERKLIADYESAIDECLRGLSAATHATAVEIAALPDEIRGFGPVKAESIAKAKQREAELLARLHSPTARAA